MVRTICLPAFVMLLASTGGCGSDETASTCGPSTCSGCCSTAGKCEQGDQPTACGTHGGMCTVCSGNQSCTNNQCGATVSCGPQTCTGCCLADKCQTGTSQTACGNGGTACLQCTASQTCDATSRTCVVPSSCNAQNCSAGCCVGTQCFTDHGAAHCGSGGQACVACVSPQTCLASGSTFACQNPSGDSYNVTLASAVIGPPSAGGNWDSTSDGCINCLVGCCPPDAYADKGSVIAGIAVPKMTVDNSLTPAWNLLVGTASATQLTGGAINIIIKDSDVSVLPDDPIGTCTGTITAADLAAGKKVILSGAGCNGAMQSLTITFTKV